MARNFLIPFRSTGLIGSGFADPFLSLHREVNRLFDDVIRAGDFPMGGAQGANLMPPVDVSETESEMVLKAEMPGVSEPDVEVTLNEDVLTIRAEKKMEHEEERHDYHFTERSFGTFQRSLRLPFQVKPDQVHANFENGVLTVRLPKAQAKERRRKIQIQKGTANKSQAQIETGSTAQENGKPTSSGAEAADKDKTESATGSGTKSSS